MYKIIIWHLCTLMCAPHPEFSLYPCPSSPLVNTILLSVSYVGFLVLLVPLLLFVSYSTYEWNHMFFVFFHWLVSLGITCSRSIMSQMTIFHLFMTSFLYNNGIYIYCDIYNGIYNGMKFSLSFIKHQAIYHILLYPIICQWLFHSKIVWWGPSWDTLWL